MIDYRIFFLLLALIGGAAAAVAAICSMKINYSPAIKPAYGNTKWAEPEELQ